MTDSKNDDGKESAKAKSQDWEFSAVSPQVNPVVGKTKTAGQVKNTKSANQKRPALTLNEAALPKIRTRSAMALEMEMDDQVDKDYFTYATYPKRGIAFIIDTVFLAGIIFMSIKSTPLWRRLIQHFLDHYKLQLLIPEWFVMRIILGATIFVSLFILIIIPVAFFNHSFGKKILGLKVRGEDKYTLSISQTFSRELIMKPISIVLLAGFITPFFSKKRLSLHDMYSHTIVIND